MNIIIIPNHPNPNMNDTFIASRHSCISKALVKQGHNIHYVVWESPAHLTYKNLLNHIISSFTAKNTRYNEYSVHQFRRLPILWPIVNGWLFKYQLKKLFKKLEIDFIFTESFTNETVIPKDLPYIYDLADDYSAPADIYGSLIYKLIFKLLGIKTTMKRHCQNAFAVTVVSESVYNYAKQYNTNVIKLPNGVDSDIVKLIKKDKSTYPKNKYSMIYITGFGKWSRAIDTLKVIKELKIEYPKIELTLIGHGTEVKKIKNFIVENKAQEYIHYLGYISDRKKIFSLMNQSTIGLNISDKNKWRDAAYPIKVIEYSSLGKKVISTDLNEVKQLKFLNIFIFSGNNKNFKYTLSKAIETKISTKKQEQISNHVLNKYNWDNIAKELINSVNSYKYL